jgi:hypothetical protein
LVGVRGQPVSDFVPSRKKTPRQLSTPAVDYRYEPIRGAVADASPHERPVGGVRCVIEFGSHSREYEILLALGILIGNAGEVRVGSNFLEDQLKVLRHQGFELADGRNATGFGQPAVDASPAIPQDSIHGVGGIR